MIKGFIAVDGGGSKTEVVLVDLLGHIFLHKLVNCSNPNDVGIETSFTTLAKTLKEFLTYSNNNQIEIEVIYLLIAGIEFGDLKKNLKLQLEKKLNFKNIKVDGDLLSVKELGLKDDSDGVVIISGTGFNMAIKKDNKFSHFGGWGYLLDDYLCGFILGKDALIASSKAIDENAKETSLVKLIENKYGNNLWYSMERIYKEGIKGVASLAPLVIKAYKDKDIVASEIIDKRVNDLIVIIKDKTMKINKPIKICLFGGIFENNDFIVEKIKNELGNNYLVEVTRKKTIFGSVLVALKSLKCKVDRDFFTTFTNDYKKVKA